MSLAVAALLLLQQPAIFSQPMQGWGGSNLDVTTFSSPKGNALRLTTSKAGDFPWSSVAHKKADIGFAEGDVVSFTAWMRSPDKARVGVMFELATAPNTKYLAAVASPPADWKEYRFAGRIPRSFAPGETQMALFMGYGKGTVELANIRFENLGKVDLSKVAQTIDYYGSAENTDEWRKPALARIEQVRKGDLVVRVLDSNGKPVPGAKVSIEQLRHAFKFGTAAPAARLVGTSADDRKFQETVKRLFNTVTFENDLKWNAIENQNYSDVDKALDWMKANGIAARGHNLLWGAERYLPNGLWAKSDAEIRSLAERRVKETAARFRGKVYLWDVVNEAVTETALWDRIGWDYFTNAFKWAREADPHALLAYNDYNITEENEVGPNHRLRAKERIEQILKAGAPLDVIGIQSHVGVPMTPMKRVLEILDEMAAYGKPLEITEYDLGVHDDKVSGEHMRDFLTAVFSHPKVDAFIMWGFWEGAHWRANEGGAIFRRDWTPREPARVYEDLVKRQWWTKATEYTNDRGEVVIRGFKGDYRISSGNKSANATIGGSKTYVTLKS